MRKPSLFFGVLLGGLSSLPVIALSYLGAHWAGLPFIPFDVFDWLARVLPGRVITAGIDSIVGFITLLGLGPISGTAKHIEQLLGLLIVIAGGMLFGFMIALVIRGSRWPGRRVGVTAGLIAFLIMTAIEIKLGTSIAGQPVPALLWLAVLIIGWGVVLGQWLTAGELAGVTPTATAEFRANRRTFLLKLAGGSIGLALAAWGLERLVVTRPRTGPAGQTLTRLGPATPGTTGPVGVQSASPSFPTPSLPATLRERMAVAPGTRPELTANPDFYRIDIDTLPPVIDRSSWRLQVTGLFDRPRSLTLSDLLTYPAVTQPITLSCISNPVGGDLISTGDWTGVRLRDVLKDLGIRPEAKALLVTAVEDFYESVEMEDLLDSRTLLVYGMNGKPLPEAHGFPLRIYIPNRYGMKQPKWITGIEASDHNGPGYWVDRGWNAEARPQIVSVIDTVARDQIENHLVPVGGIAWAGDRGIQKVEVQVDEGTWAEAVLRTPPLSPLTWIQWRYDWPAMAGQHTFRVRATDGSGALQIEAQHDTYPDGATGYHSVTATIADQALLQKRRDG
jgi:DMSO/TMAO reductase YedYZ molybdopterin-dependent catalytic subunit